MKHFFLLFMALVASTALWAADFEVDGIAYNKLGGDSVEVTSKSSTYSGDITIPSTVTYESTTYRVTCINSYAFYWSDSIISINIPNSVTHIIVSTFDTISSLTSINVDVANTQYASIDGVLFNYTKDTLIKYPIGNKRTTYTIPNSVTSIRDGAFYYCHHLTSVTIPNSATNIGSWAFYACTSLCSVAIPNSVTSIGRSSFEWCSSLTSITIPNSVTSIGDDTFHGCTSLASITIPNSVTSIGDYAFNDCTSLKHINVDPDNTHYASLDGVLFNYTKDTLIQYSIGNARTTYTIPNSVTCIGRSAFSSCHHITSITIPNNVTSIGSSAFHMCNNITSVTWNTKNCNSYNFGSQVETFTFGDSIEVIPSSICSGMFKLSSITIPNSVTNLGNSAFYGCTSLADIYSYAEVPPTAGNSTFSNVSKHCYIHVPAGTIRDYQMAMLWRDFYHFFEISALPEGQTEVGVIVTNNSATFSWPANPTASSYTLEIKKDGELFCSLIFNTMGQLVGMNFAPSRGAANATATESTTYGYSFVINGLDDNGEYQYIFASLGEFGTILDSKTGTFSTAGTTLYEIDSQMSKVESQKIMIDGQLYILREGKMYNALGGEL